MNVVSGRRRRRAITAAVLACSVTGLALLVTVASPIGPDAAAARGAAALPEAWIPVVRGITWLGASTTVAALAAIVALWVVIGHQDPLAAIYLAAVLAAEIVVANTIKAIVDRPRPEVEQIVGWSGASFPSGHSAAAAAAYLAIAFVLARGRPAADRKWLVAIAVGIALLVASSRVLLGVHWTTDVAAGLMLGWSLALGASLLLPERRADQNSSRRRIALGRPSGSTSER